jgi:hypothetical protein
MVVKASAGSPRELAITAPRNGGQGHCRFPESALAWCHTLWWHVVAVPAMQPRCSCVVCWGPDASFPSATCKGIWLAVLYEWASLVGVRERGCCPLGMREMMLCCRSVACRHPLRPLLHSPPRRSLLRASAFASVLDVALCRLALCCNVLTTADRWGWQELSGVGRSLNVGLHNSHVWCDTFALSCHCQSCHCHSCRNTRCPCCARQGPVWLARATVLGPSQPPLVVALARGLACAVACKVCRQVSDRVSERQAMQGTRQLCFLALLTAPVAYPAIYLLVSPWLRMQCAIYLWTG